MPSFGSFRTLHSLTPPLPGNFGSFRHHFGKASLTGDSFGFFRQRFGSFRLREAKREGGQRGGWSGEGIQKEGGVPALCTWLSCWGEWRKRRADLAEGLRRLRETKAAGEVKGARGRCGGCQRGFVRLRTVEAEGCEMGFCACVEVGLSGGFSLIREASGFQSPQHACARLSLPPGRVPNSRPLSKATRSWLPWQPRQRARPLP